ncbi:Hypp8328 [Branchiostoma lanceolatum]|uniref:Hypp8328 protein n=1 Tax=Branchiostoma lanceolatum TaxID=7740 RepID=A0A8K0EF71_BRALA|nr:Hypp8328 [Branchiostoma lanceolatum]
MLLMSRYEAEVHHTVGLGTGMYGTTEVRVTDIGVTNSILDPITPASCTTIQSALLTITQHPCPERNKHPGPRITKHPGPKTTKHPAQGPLSQHNPCQPQTVYMQHSAASPDITQPLYHHPGRPTISGGFHATSPAEEEARAMGEPVREPCGLHGQLYMQNLRCAGGGVVNRIMAMGAARGLVMEKDRSLLAEYGGGGWVQKSVRKIPDDFEKTQDKFEERIEEVVCQHDIPEEMILNLDQTGVNIVPVGTWTLKEEGSKHVPITSLEDKRQITVLLTTTLSGKLFPSQVLYHGKTDACHPTFQFLEEWDIFYTESYCPTVPNILRYADRLLIPYMESQ